MTRRAGPARRRADRAAAVADVEEVVAELRDLVLRAGALTHAVEDLASKIAWDDRCDPRDEDLRVAHLSCLIELALETSAAAHEASDEVASELFKLRTSSRREIARRG